MMVQVSVQLHCPLSPSSLVQETTTVTAAAYANETDLSRRVADWEAKIKPILDNEVATVSYNICVPSIYQQYHYKTSLYLPLTPSPPVFLFLLCNCAYCCVTEFDIFMNQFTCSGDV